MATDALERLLRLPERERRTVLASLTEVERATVALLIDQRVSNPWSKYEDDPVGFVTQGLGESLWSRQREILESLKDNKRTVVPACHAPGKSHLAARAVAWWIAVHPPGTAMAVTTATTFRQVRNILWTQLRRLQQTHNLPGETTQIEWRIGTELVAYGFSPRDTDETSVQGIHAPHLLVVVDEAGGIPHTLGRALEAIMTGGHTRLLAIGNPPTDVEDSWFERICNSDLYNVIPISVYDTPNFTGEDVDICRTCPKEVLPHSIKTHLVDQEWVRDVINEFGDESAFVEARVHARFPRSAPNKVIPLSWVEAALENQNPIQSPEIRLGVDVAADGGDEFVIARADGFEVTMRHNSSGQSNQNAVDVAGVVLEHIRQAEADAKERRVREPIKVKVDTIGVGWGVVSILQRWKDEQMHNSIIVPVNVAERARDAGKFSNQRSEMWWNARTLFQPQVRTEGAEPTQDVKLSIDRRTLAQLSAPLYRSDSSGRIKIETKIEMKRRGINSPDRAEAVLLALYDPPGAGSVPLVNPVGLDQSNVWSF
jgi:hypothetical protein